MNIKDDDLISRKAAIDLMLKESESENCRKYQNINNRLGYYRYLHGECCFRKSAKLLENMPAVADQEKADELSEQSELKNE